MRFHLAAIVVLVAISFLPAATATSACVNGTCTPVLPGKVSVNVCAEESEGRTCYGAQARVAGDVVLQAYWSGEAGSECAYVELAGFVLADTC